MIADRDVQIIEFSAYQETFERAPENLKPFGLGKHVVLSMESQLHKKHEVYFSNYLISVPLLKHLKNVGVRACVTIKANRKFLPTYLKQGKAMMESAFDYYRVSCTVILIIVYRDFDYCVP